MINGELKDALHKRLTDDIQDFTFLGNTRFTQHGPMIHIDRGSKILAVAHLDWVLWDHPTYYNQYVCCPQLDDRLGAWVILDLLPSWGLEYDVLLCDSEEVGNSTAQYFKTEKEYNWMFEFDRSGTETVMYQYEQPRYTKILRDFQFDVGIGSFSDIAYLDELGCAGFNFGTGYYHEHTYRCFADLTDTIGMARS
jgi:hypothetical protein